MSDADIDAAFDELESLLKSDKTLANKLTAAKDDIIKEVGNRAGQRKDLNYSNIYNFTKYFVFGCGLKKRCGKI